MTRGGNEKALILKSSDEFLYDEKNESDEGKLYDVVR